MINWGCLSILLILVLLRGVWHFVRIVVPVDEGLLGPAQVHALFWLWLRKLLISSIIVVVLNLRPGSLAGRST